MPRASLKQRKDGRYCAKYKGKQFLGSTQSEAYAKRDAYKKQIEAGLRAEMEGIGLLQYATSWVHVYKHHVTDRTFGDYVRYLNAFVNAVGDKRISDIVPSDIQKAYNGLSGYSYSYISTYTQLVNGMFSAAVADRIILSNPCLSVKTPKANAGSHRAIEEWERQLILQSAHRFTPAVLTMLFAGLRRGEVLALNVGRDVDFKNMTITVSEAVRFDNNIPIISDPKTEAGKRTIPLLDILADVLQPIQGLVAPSASGTLMSESAVKKAWKSYVIHLETLLNSDIKRWYGNRKGQGEAWLQDHPWQKIDLRTHDLRHSYCTMLYDSGIDIKTAMKWMGHADQTMTLRIYTHLTSEKEAASANKLRSKVNQKIRASMQKSMQNPISA